MERVSDTILRGGEDGRLANLASFGSESAARELVERFLRRNDPRGELGMLLWTLGRAPMMAAERNADLARLASLRTRVDRSWEELLSRFEAPLNCGAQGRDQPLRFARTCDERWESMDPLEAPGTRLCARCHEVVHLCDDRAQAERLARQGACITIPAAVAQHTRDALSANVTGRLDWRAAWAGEIFVSGASDAVSPDGAEALLAEVIARPEDDAPRYAYAEALGEDPRAEFIRIQLEAGGRRIAGATTPRERELLAQHRSRWLGPLEAVVEAAGFSRGFVEEVTMDAAAFTEHHATLFSLAPIKELALTRASGRPEVFGVRELRRVRALSLSGGLTDADITALVACPHLDALVRLDLRHNRISPEGVRSIAAAPFLRGLLGLDVSGNPTPDPHATALGEEPDVIWQLGPLHQELLTRHGPLPWLVRRDAGGLPSLGSLERSRPKASPASTSK